MVRSYYARELVTFAKFKVDKSVNGEYLLIGYLNNDKTKFKDIKTGKIYPISEVAPRADRVIPRHVMVINGQTFIQIGMRTQERELDGAHYLWFSDKCIFSKITSEPFLIHDLHPRFNSLYDFVKKKQNSSMGVVGFDSLLQAVQEANRYAETLIEAHKDMTDDYDLEIDGDGISITKEERDF